MKIMMPNGQIIAALSLPEAIERSGATIEQLAEWLRAGAIQGCKCPNCGLQYPLVADMDDLLQFAEQFPLEVPLDEIVTERVKSIGRRGEVAEKTRRFVHADPRGKMRATDAYYEEEDEGQQQRGTRQRSSANAGLRVDRDEPGRGGALQRLLPGQRRR